MDDNPSRPAEILKDFTFYSITSITCWVFDNNNDDYNNNNSYNSNNILRPYRFLGRGEASQCHLLFRVFKINTFHISHIKIKLNQN